MREVHHIALALVVLTFLGCKHVPPTAEAPRSIVVDRTLVYSDGQHAEADVVTYFEGWNRMFLHKPQVNDGRYALPLAKERFMQMLEALGVERRFVVVILQKSVQPPEAQLLDELERFFRDCRFRRVVMQQARGIGPQPVLRDTAEAK
jgi:hypothetical protein